jgi:hypothetical protein
VAVAATAGLPAAGTVHANVADPDARVPSVSVTVTDDVPPAVGVPEMTPVRVTFPRTVRFLSPSPDK